MQQQYEQAYDEQSNKLAQSKGISNRKWRQGDKDMLPKFLVLREVRLRLEKVWRHEGSPRSQLGPPYSPHALTKARCRDPLRSALEGDDRTFTNKVGALSTTQLEAPNTTTKLHHNGIWLRGDLIRLGHQCTQE